MSDNFVAEIRIFPFNFAPSGWATCDGQLMSISQNTALFSLLGTNYGGDGKSNFGLPNLNGRAPLQQGQGPGLSQYFLGQLGGVETETLILAELPQHNHALSASSASATAGDPGSTLALARSDEGVAAYAAPGNSGSAPMPAVATTGGDQPHNNMMPYLTLTFCIALQGVFPQRS
jgi:microcystin-dependent protein